jgi:hypothetical protein
MPRPKRESKEVVSEHIADEGMRRFTQALSGVLAVSKKEADRRYAEWKRKRRGVKGSGQ